MTVPTIDWCYCLIANVLLTYIPHLFLRVPAVNAKLAADHKARESKAGLKGYSLAFPRVAQAAAADDSKEGRYIQALNGHHSNSHEAFPIFAAACLAAAARGVGAGVRVCCSPPRNRFCTAHHAFGAARPRAHFERHPHTHAHTHTHARARARTHTAPPAQTINFWATVFTASRLVYTAAYLGGLSSVRPLVWAAGFGVLVWMFLLASRA